MKRRELRLWFALLTAAIFADGVSSYAQHIAGNPGQSLICAGGAALTAIALWISLREATK